MAGTVPDDPSFSASKSDLLPLPRSQRLLGLLIVLAVAFLSSVVHSIARVVGFDLSYPDSLVKLTYFDGILRELTSLAVLAYVVQFDGRTFRDLGLNFSARDLPYGFLLWVVATGCYRLVYPIILSVSESMGWHPAVPYVPSLRLGLGLLTYCFIAVNPVFEEMIVRAFLMSETLALTGSASLAVLCSVLLQTSYHLYQGVPYALALVPLFLIFSIYYAHTRRIFPLIVAHFITDLYAHLHHAMYHARVLH